MITSATCISRMHIPSNLCITFLDAKLCLTWWTNALGPVTVWTTEQSADVDYDSMWEIINVLSLSNVWFRYHLYSTLMRNSDLRCGPRSPLTSSDQWAVVWLFIIDLTAVITHWLECTMEIYRLIIQSMVVMCDTGERIWRKLCADIQSSRYPLFGQSWQFSLNCQLWPNSGYLLDWISVHTCWQFRCSKSLLRKLDLIVYSVI